MQNYIVIFIFSLLFLDQESPFWANLLQKIKIVSLSRNLVPNLIQMGRFQWWYSFIYFGLKVPFLGYFFQKIKLSA